MSDVNKVKLEGVVSDEVKIVNTQGGRTLLKFTVLTKADNFTHYQQCLAWEQLAEQNAEWVKQGVRVGLVGRLRANSWVDKNGLKRKDMEVVCSEIYDVEGGEAPQEDF